MHDILSSSKSAVLVNGCPGRWINCKRGQRQGDPLSPYLFLLVTDTLQAMIRQAIRIRHPIDSDAPCCVLQYADDTLIVLRGDFEAAQELKSILDNFSEATGLKINYSKSTLVSIHMDVDLVYQCTTAIGCSKQSFPKTTWACLCQRQSSLSLLSPLMLTKLTDPLLLASLGSQQHG